MSNTNRAGNRPYSEATVKLAVAAIVDANWRAKNPGNITAEACAVLDALAAAGLLLPEGAETRTEWGVWWYGPIGDGIRLTQDKFASRAAAGQHAPTRIGDYGITRYEIRRRIHRVFPDGSSWSGPWEPDAVRLAVGDSKPTQDHVTEENDHAR